MKAKWEPRVLEIGFQAVSEQEYERRLEDVARIVYEWICQLRKGSQISFNPVESQARSVPIPSEQPFRRTESHGY